MFRNNVSIVNLSDRPQFHQSYFITFCVFAAVLILPSRNPDTVSTFLFRCLQQFSHSLGNWDSRQNFIIQVQSASNCRANLFLPKTRIMQINFNLSRVAVPVDFRGGDLQVNKTHGIAIARTSAPKGAENSLL